MLTVSLHQYRCWSDSVTLFDFSQFSVLPFIKIVNVSLFYVHKTLGIRFFRSMAVQIY